MGMGAKIFTAELARQNTHCNTAGVASGLHVNHRVTGGQDLADVVHARLFHGAMDHAGGRAAFRDVRRRNHSINGALRAGTHSPTKRFQPGVRHVVVKACGQGNLDAAAAQGGMGSGHSGQGNGRRGRLPLGENFAEPHQCRGNTVSVGLLAAKLHEGWLRHSALAKQPGASYLWRTSYLGTDAALHTNTHDAESPSGGPVTVHTSRGSLTASRVIVCVGHDLDYVHPDVAEPFEVNRCALAMALVRPVEPAAISRAVLTGTSMLRYPAFAETSAAAALRTELENSSPELLAIDANLMLTRRPDGTLLIGDSHHTETSLDPQLRPGQENH